MNIKSTMENIALLAVTFLFALVLTGCGLQAEPEIVATAAPTEEVPAAALDSRIQLSGSRVSTDRFSMTLPEGLAASTDTDGNLLILKDGEQAGSLTIRKAPGFELNYPVSTEDNTEQWLAAMGLVLDANAGWMTGSSMYGLLDVSMGYQDEKGNLFDLNHTLFEYEDAIYDVWFRIPAIEGEDADAAMEKVFVGREPTAETPVTLGSLTMPVPAKCTVETEADGSLSFLKRGEQVGGAVIRQKPGFQRKQREFSNASAWADALLGPDRPSQFSCADTPPYGDLHIECSGPALSAKIEASRDSKAPKAEEFNLTHTFFVTGDTVYDLCLDNKVLESSVSRAVLDSIIDIT